MIQLRLLGINKDTSGIVGRTPERPNCSFGKSVKLLGESLLGLAFGSKLLFVSRVGCHGLHLCGCQDFAKYVDRALLGRRLAFPGPIRRCGRSGHSIHLLECPGGKYGPHGELLFFLIKKEPVAVSNEVPFKLVLLVETLKVCALVGLHFLAAEGEAGSIGSQSPELGDMWRQGCPKSPEWISSCSASETFLGCEMYEHNIECRASEVIGQDWSSEVVALFLEDWELGRDHGPSLQRSGRVGVAQSRWVHLVHCVRSVGKVLLRNRGLGAWRVNCHSKQKPFSHRGWAVTIKERDVVREKKKEGV